MFEFKTLLQLKNLHEKKVLLRLDLNVPIQHGVIKDVTRLIEAKDTINYLLTSRAKIIIFSHLGRVKNETDKKNNSLLLVYQYLQNIMFPEIKIRWSSATSGKRLEQIIDILKAGEILLVENTRFEDIHEQKESSNNAMLGQYWASLGDVFVNDAFGTAHRAHASNVGIATYCAESAIGFLVEKELNMLFKVVNQPTQPFYVILGGAKASDKLNVVTNLIAKTKKIVIAGVLSFTFLKSQGYEMGTSRVEADKLDFVKELWFKHYDQIILPIDFYCAESIAPSIPVYVDGRNIPQHLMIVDIGPKSVSLFKEILQDAATIFWNGPVGVFEVENYAFGTKSICEIVANLTNKDTLTIIGGGDSASAICNFGFKDQVSFISTGGGASLTYLEGKPLPGIETLKVKKSLL